MKHIIDIINSKNTKINEKLVINKNTTVRKKEFTDEELRYDYECVNGAFSKSEKEPYMVKYDTTINKIRDIQLIILDKLRENRQKKNKFDDDDVIYFRRFDIPWGKYDKAKTYLDQEPKDFLEYVFKYYEKKANKINPYRHSIAEGYTLRIYNCLKKYLGK